MRDFSIDQIVYRVWENPFIQGCRVTTIIVDRIYGIVSVTLQTSDSVYIYELYKKDEALVIEAFKDTHRGRYSTDPMYSQEVLELVAKLPDSWLKNESWINSRIPVEVWLTTFLDGGWVVKTYPVQNNRVKAQYSSQSTQYELQIEYDKLAHRIAAENGIELYGLEK